MNNSLMSSPSSLPPNFRFSQSSLQALVDCLRMFQLRYIQRVAWPAPLAEPVDDYEDMQIQGQAFHHLVHQSLLGIPAEYLTRSAESNARLAGWWRNFLEKAPDLQDFKIYPEISISTPFGNHRLVAKFDLLAIHPATSDHTPPSQTKAVIYDWKTSHNRPKRVWQASKLQSRVYPYVLVKASEAILGFPLQPEQVEMVYWFSNFPTAPMAFEYSQEKLQSDEHIIRELIATALQLGEQEAPKTDQVKRCRFCVYRSLCDRGTTAASIFDDPDVESDIEPTSDTEFDFDFDQIAEVEF
jgi:hypothetical protein